MGDTVGGAVVSLVPRETPVIVISRFLNVRNGISEAHFAVERSGMFMSGSVFSTRTI